MVCKNEKQIAVMQPYFFPYAGYWQLMNAVDTFVIYDDVNFIKKGWINRNRILINNKPQFIHLPCQKISQNKRINEIEIMLDESTAAKLLRTIELAYKRAPYFNDAMPVVEEILRDSHTELTGFLQHQFTVMAGYLKIDTELLVSSEIEKDDSLRAENKVIDICRRLGGTAYVNPICGAHLYSPERFSENGLELRFIELPEIRYRQYGEGWTENLSIIDVMMFNRADKVKEFLDSASIIDASAVQIRRRPEAETG